MTKADAMLKEEMRIIMLKGLSYKVPKWLTDEFGRTQPKGIISDLHGVPGFDHVRTYKSRVVVSQPYEANGEPGNVLTKLHAKGICIRVWGVSPYFSGRTFSLVLWRPEDAAVASELMERMFQNHPTQRTSASAGF
jgi:hypothetical protein